MLQFNELCPRFASVPPGLLRDFTSTQFEPSSETFEASLAIFDQFLLLAMSLAAPESANEFWKVFNVQVDALKASLRSPPEEDTVTFILSTKATISDLQRCKCGASD